MARYEVDGSVFPHSNIETYEIEEMSSFVREEELKRRLTDMNEKEKIKIETR